MGVVNYYGTEGESFGDSQAGDYLRDALGSVSATSSPSMGSVQNTYRYKPYGSQLATTGGSATPKFQWVGTAGYRSTAATHSDIYVRDRHYASREGEWTTSLKDLLIGEHRYNYAENNPVTYTDPTGEFPQGKLQPPKRARKPNIPLQCMKRRPAFRCYECAYKYFRSQQAMPLAACEAAKRICRSGVVCGPCGHMPFDASRFKISCETLPDAIRYFPGGIGEFFHDFCGGPGGADKLAHCFGACMIAACYSVFGSAALSCYRNNVEIDEDPNDATAEHIGTLTGNGASVQFATNIVDECIAGCAEGTKELPVGPLPGNQRW